MSLVDGLTGDLAGSHGRHLFRVLIMASAATLHTQAITTVRASPPRQYLHKIIREMEMQQEEVGRGLEENGEEGEVANVRRGEYLL